MIKMYKDLMKDFGCAAHLSIELMRYCWLSEESLIDTSGSTKDIPEHVFVQFVSLLSSTDQTTIAIEGCCRMFDKICKKYTSVKSPEYFLNLKLPQKFDCPCEWIFIIKLVCPVVLETIALKYLQTYLLVLGLQIISWVMESNCTQTQGTLTRRPAMIMDGECRILRPILWGK